MKRILLMCSAGMSTSLLVMKMQQAAKQQGIDVEIEAVAEADLQSHLKNTNVILLGPQVRFLLSKVREVAGPKGIAVDIVDSRDYGSMDGQRVLDKALKLLDS